jgi:hypothetical protein
MSRPSLRLFAAASFTAVLAASASLGSLSDAHACAVFVPVDPALGQARLDLERVLIVYDEASSTEHFIREITVAKGAKRFGFVVPLPARPTLAKVEHDVFAGLAESFPAVPPSPAPPPQSAPFWRSLSKSTEDRAVASAGVEVQATERIGSFTAVTLAATDTAALQTWLRENGLSSPPAHTAWLAHYVALGFTFVAFRFEAPASADGDAELTSERVRLSFPSPAPFYPYLEPAREAERGGAAPRTLAAWLLSTHTLRPLAAHVGGSADHLSLTHGNPWSSGLEYTGGPSLGPVLGPELVKLVESDNVKIHTFTDHKASRNGWGDIVFVPRQPTPTPFGADRKAALRPFLSILDPALGGPEAMVSIGGAR